MMRLWMLLFALSCGPAQAVELHGRLEQGGLALGRAAPGAAITLDGKPVASDETGNFIIGFSRDAAERAVLTIGAEIMPLTIAKRDWPEQKINGLPQSKVAPDPAQLKRIAEEGEIIKLARARITQPAYFLQGWTQPADGPISGLFGSRRILNGEARAPHSGTDIAAPLGAPVRAVGAGMVDMVHPDMFFTGQTVMIDHGLGLQSVYAHMSRTDVHVGDVVKSGQIIGAVGASGRATGPHLHWGASWGETRLDPQTALDVLAPAQSR